MSSASAHNTAARWGTIMAYHDEESARAADAARAVVRRPGAAARTDHR
jgi:hypothetical protein